MSFNADTAVATPQGERPIGSLKIGDTVEAYNPSTSHADLLDVALRPHASFYTS